jgi:opacity protein-like surface antigen
MRNKILSSLSITLLAFTMTAKAQPDYAYIERKGWSLGMNVGIGDLWGDVGTKSPIEHYKNDKYSSYLNVSGGLFVRYTFKPAFVFRAAVNYGTFAAGDNMNVNLAKKALKYESDEVQRYQRNLDVKTNIWEGSVMFEINPLRFNPLSRTARMHFQPYLLVGISGYHFVSKGRFVAKNNAAGASNGQYIKLYDLHIEGDGFKGDGMPAAYSKWQMAVPLGIGGKWDLSPKMALGIEYVYRMCFTDYLDGVSQNYIDPKLYKENGLTDQQAIIATAMRDKSWEIDKNKIHKTGEKRGNNAGGDAYSTISISLYYKFKSRANPWWE